MIRRQIVCECTSSFPLDLRKKTFILRYRVRNIFYRFALIPLGANTAAKVYRCLRTKWWLLLLFPLWYLWPKWLYQLVLDELEEQICQWEVVEGGRFLSSSSCKHYNSWGNEFASICNSVKIFCSDFPLPSTHTRFCISRRPCNLRENAL